MRVNDGIRPADSNLGLERAATDEQAFGFFITRLRMPDDGTPTIGLISLGNRNAMYIPEGSDPQDQLHAFHCGIIASSNRLLTGLESPYRFAPVPEE